MLSKYMRRSVEHVEKSLARPRDLHSLEQRRNRRIAAAFSSYDFEEERSRSRTLEDPVPVTENMNGADSLSVCINIYAAAPDMKLTSFALRLALLDKAVNGLGTLAFIWATVVLLGDFAVTLETLDFWFVSIILLIEGTRIFRLSTELKWQRQITPISVPSLRDYGIQAVDDDNLLNRTWSTPMVQLLSYSGWQLLPWLQLLLALTCAVLSLQRLVKQDYGVVSGSGTKNRKSALNIFYVLSLADALLYLLQKVYWHSKIIRRKLFEEVTDEYGFHRDEVRMIRRYFDVIYSRCINESILDGSKMEFVSYGIELLQSGDGEVLSKLAKSNRFAEQTLREIGTMKDVVDSLIKMLTWKDHDQQVLRRAAAEIISNLVKIKYNKCIRVMGIAGYEESIESLLYDDQEIEIHSRQYGDPFIGQSYDYSGFSQLGLRILERLANDRENCSKIRSSRCLFPKIVALTELKLNAPDSQIETVKQALRLLGMLLNTTDPSRKISETVISTHGLQIVAIDTLKSLALEKEGRENVGSCSGVLLHNLRSVFFMDINTSGDSKTSELVAKAGDLLSLLSFEDASNWERIRIKSVELQDRPNLAESLRTVLDDPVRGSFATIILRNIEKAGVTRPYHVLRG